MIRQIEIKELIEALGIKKTFIAKKIGITRQVLSYQLNTAKDLDYEYYFKIKELLQGMQPEKTIIQKLTVESKSPFNNTIQSNSYPLLDYIYAGEPDMLTYEPTNEYISVPYSKKENCFGIRVIGDSMNGIVAQGDTAFVDMTADLFDGCIAAVRLKRNGEQMIKRYHKLKDARILLSSDNASYKPIEYHLKEIEAIYRVIKIIKEV